MASAILQGAADARLLNYVIFPGPLGTSLAAVCGALHQAAQSDAAIVHCSFGLRHDRRQLARAVAAVLSAGKRLVASAPAREGSPVYPSQYDGVIAVQGDARCVPQEWSWLNLPHAEFGACPSGAGADLRGASVAAAHFTGLLARETGAGREALTWQNATYQGRERILETGGYTS